MRRRVVAALRICRSRSLAEDAVQEAFLSVVVHPSAV
jgi:DNA-directed RNA polymerase specialized sigma24 family protein